jgi:hypothetical protein
MAAQPDAPLAPVMPQVPTPGSAKDDLPHRTAELAPLFAHAAACVPRSNKLALDLEAFDGHLVACAQARTRRDESVFFDSVSYACWDVDPANGGLARRTDHGRAFFACRDGKCEPETPEVTSYDGRALLVYDDVKHPLEIYERRADGSRGARTHSFAVPPELAKANPDHGEVVYVGQTIFARGSDTTVVLDDAGHVLGTAPGNRVDALDDTHALIRTIEHEDAPDPDHLAIRSSLRGTLWAEGHGAPVTLDRDYTAGPVLLGSAAYALAGRTLYVLDPKTLHAKKSYPIATCH